jgi:hypothetical protein
MFPMTVTVSNPAQLSAIIAALGMSGELPPITTPKVEAPVVKPSKKAQAEVAPNTASDGAPADPAAFPATDSAGPAPSPAVAVAPLTYDQVKPLITGWTKGRDALVALLAEFGAQRGTDLKPEQYADFVAKAKAHG